MAVKNRLTEKTVAEVLALLGEPRRMGHERRCARPSFETPRKRAAPQDDGGMCGTAYKSRQKPAVEMLASFP